MESQESYDYVVIGAGSAGCAVATRLSQSGLHTVALIEAGPRDRNPWIHIPVGYYRTKSNPRLTWGYRTEPEAQLNGRQINWPRGRVVGGCSSINGLLYIRGHPQDYEGWVAAGAAGWGWSDMLPIFKAMEDQERGTDAYHGVGGPLGVVDLKPKHPLMDAYLQAAEQQGLPINPDFNSAMQDGVGYFQLTLRNGRRCSAATGYLHPNLNRPNLHLVADTQVERLMMDGTRVTGIKARCGEAAMQIEARREVIVCCGSIGSPQLLELSGIGDPEVLRRSGITPRIALPQVGENLQDHFQVKLVFRCGSKITINDVLNNPLRKALVGLEYAMRRTGLMTVGAAQVSGFARVMPDATRPDMQIHAMPASSDDPARGMDPFSAFTSSVSQLRPESRGSVHITSPDPHKHPVIRANYLSAELDRRLIVRAIRLGRAIARAEPLANYVTGEHLPGEALDSDDELLEAARQLGSTNYHPVGTCRIGPDGVGVVGPDLKVHGIGGLRVADASVMPTLVSGNTNAPSIAIGEKAAQLILHGC
jgi:choline dehydrogenase